jgi:hypothetical protein
VAYSDGRMKKTNIVIPTAAKCCESRSRRPMHFFRKGNYYPRRVHWSKEAKGKNAQQARTG